MKNLPLVFILAAASLAGTSSLAATQPNIVVILTDEQGYADISLNSQHPNEVSTPNMDALAKDGVVFSHGYTSGRVNSPIRAGIRIGGYSQSVGVYTAGDGGRGFDPKKKVFPGYLPEEYVSSAIGKWHLGLDEDYPELKWITTIPGPISDGPKRKDREKSSDPIAKKGTQREAGAKMTREEKDAAKEARKMARKSIKAAGKESGAPAKASAKETPLMKASTTPADGRAPATRFDLSHWKLTLPTDASNTYGGHAAEISATKLAAGFNDSHFRTDADGAMVFWCPVAGATTEGTQFPRCELREMLNPGDVDMNWTPQGTHTLRANCRITQVPSYPKIVIGQIHSYSGKAKPLVKLQYYKDRIEALVKISPTAGKDRKLTFADAKAGDDIRYEIKVQDNVLSVTVNGETQTEDIIANDLAWARQSFYFKAGAYPQDNEGPLTEAGCIVFSELSVSHQP